MDQSISSSSGDTDITQIRSLTDASGKNYSISSPQHFHGLFKQDKPTGHPLCFSVVLLVEYILLFKSVVVHHPNLGQLVA